VRISKGSMVAARPAKDTQTKPSRIRQRIGLRRSNNHAKSFLVCTADLRNSNHLSFETFLIRRRLEPAFELRFALYTTIQDTQTPDA
jgi:hypothetical protein